MHREPLPQRVIDAARAAGLTRRRDALLAALPHAIADGLPDRASPRDQLDSDIRLLAAMWPVEGHHPLEHWLTSACALAREAAQPATADLEALLEEVRRASLDHPLSNSPEEAGYRAALIEHCRRLSSVGLPTTSMTVDFDHLFVDIAVVVAGEDVKPITTLPRHLTPGQCLVLHGGAGVGKTTACRALIRSLCQSPTHLPLWVRLRAWDPSTDVLDWLADRTPDVRCRRAHAEATLAAGRAVLFLDGLDEIGRDSERESLLQWIAATRSRWPAAMFVVTTRPDIDDEEMLPATRIYLSRLTAEERTMLIHRWCEAIHGEPDDDRAAAMKASITAQIESSAALDHIIDTPLMVTLVVLVHLAHGSLPTDRQRLVERCIDVLLETWPESRGGINPIDDPDVSRAAAERLALALVFPDDGSVSPARLGGPLELVYSLAETALEAEGISGPRRSLARRWVDHLIRACGLFHPTGNGWVEFAHRVFADALVAAGVERIHKGSVAEWIVRHHHHFAEAVADLLLARPRDRAFGSALQDGLMGMLGRSEIEPAIHLLLATVQADFDWSDDDWSALHDRIFEHIIPAAFIELSGYKPRSREIFVRSPEWPRAVVSVADLVKVHPPTRAALETRLHRSLAVDLGESLVGAVAWALRSQWVPDPTSIIQAREDAADAFDACRPLWPTAFVGWAPEETKGDPPLGGRQRLTYRRSPLQREVGARLRAPAALSRLDGIADDDLLLVTVVTLLDHGVGDPTLAALSLRLGETALRLGCHDADGAERLLGPPPAGLVSAGDYVSARPGEQPVMVRPRRPPFAPGSARHHASRLEIGALRAAIDRGEVPGRSSFLVRGAERLPPRLEGSLLEAVASSAVDSTRLEEVLPWGWDMILMVAITKDSKRYGMIVSDGSPPRAMAPARAFPVCQPGATLPPTIPRPAVEPTSSLPDLDDPSGAFPAFCRLQRRWLLDAHVAGCYRDVLDPSDAIDAYAHRLRALNTLAVWPWFDELLVHARQSRDGILRGTLQAVYLALGWSAHTTTGQWPTSRLWSAMFAGQPAHWLARAHWHLCWLAHRPGDEGHRRAFEETVARGLRDPILAPIAERMSEWRPARGEPLREGDGRGGVEA